MSSIATAKSPLPFSSNLFKLEECLPLTFYVYPSSDLDDIVKLIQGGGGKVVDIDYPGAIYLSSSTNNVDNQNCVCTSYIYSCCLNNKLLDVDEFRLKPAKCSCQSLFESLDDFIKCKSHNGNSSDTKIWTIVKHITTCDDLWKGIAESKECGDVSWKEIRNDFSLWAFLKLRSSKEKHDSCMSCIVSSLKSRNEKDPKISDDVSEASHSPILIKVETDSEMSSEEIAREGIREILPKCNLENGPSEMVKESSENRQKLKQSAQEESKEIVSSEEKRMEVNSTVGGLRIENVRSLSSSSDSLRPVSGDTNMTVQDSHLSSDEVDADQTNVQIGDDSYSCDPGHSRWPSNENGSSKISDGICKASHNPSVEGEAGTSAGVCANTSDSQTTGEEIGQVVTQKDLENRSSETVEESSKNEQRVVSLGEEGARTDVNGEEGNKRTEVGNTLRGAWLGKEQMKSLSSVSGGVKPDSEERLVLDSSSDTEMEDSNDTDCDLEVKECSKSATKPWKARQYSMKEDLKLLQWIAARRRKTLYGNRIWQFMERKKVLPNRSWQSMRERFRRRIVPNLKKYALRSDEMRRLKDMLS